jgi:hypothetical protein
VRSLLFLDLIATGRDCSGEPLELLNLVGELTELPCNTLEGVRERLTTSAQVSKLYDEKFVVGVRGVGARPRNFHSSPQTSFLQFCQECIQCHSAILDEPADTQMREKSPLGVSANRFGTKPKVGRGLVCGEQRLDLQLSEIVSGNWLSSGKRECLSHIEEDILRGSLRVPRNS